MAGRKFRANLIAFGGGFSLSRPLHHDASRHENSIKFVFDLSQIDRRSKVPQLDRNLRDLRERFSKLCQFHVDASHPFAKMDIRSANALKTVNYRQC